MQDMKIFKVCQHAALLLAMQHCLWSAGFMLQNPDDAVIWRGPRKNALIKQFLKDVDWGVIDYLVVDAPPGYGLPCSDACIV